MSEETNSSLEASIIPLIFPREAVTKALLTASTVVFLFSKNTELENSIKKVSKQNYTQPGNSKK